MNIIEIKESGSNNVLLWAIKNNANIKSDIPLQEIINQELFYLVTIEDVNQFELFRLTQTYRNKLRIVDEKTVEVPNQRYLTENFPGVFSDPEDSNKHMPMSEVAEHAITNFINIALQMKCDSDIISSNAAHLYIPMIARKYTIQIPISFIDVIDSIKPENNGKLFNSNYPNNLVNLLDNPYNDIFNMIRIIFVKLTAIRKFNMRYEKYINYIKFAPLSKVSNDKLYKIYLLGFHKFNPIGRSISHCSLFNINEDSLTESLKSLGYIKSPLELDFAIQLPIQVMQLLENSFGEDIIKISYENSMISILDEGLLFNDFTVPDISNEESDNKNSISAYRVRLTEANQFALNTIKLLTENEDSNIPASFAILPSMYMAKAVITISIDNIDMVISKCKNEIISEMFKMMMKTSKKILLDITKSME